MSKIQKKEMVIGDVLKWELPHELCRVNKIIKCNPSATIGLVVGEIMEPATAVEQVHVFTCASGAPNDGTYKLGYKGQWTSALDYDASEVDIKDALEALSTVDDTITVSGALGVGTTFTWTTAGLKYHIDIDARLLLDGLSSMDGLCDLDISVVGSTADEMDVISTGANATGILLEKVTLEDLQTMAGMARSFLVKGNAVVDGDNLYAVAAQLADAKAALEVLGITIRNEPTVYSSGVPTS